MTHENETTTNQKLCDAAKAVLREEFIALMCNEKKDLKSGF